MAKAHYQVLLPNHARHIGLAAHHYLTGGAIRGIHAATLQYGHPHDSLMVVGEETPELDSHMKQTATFIGDVANAPSIDVIKNGKNLAHWTMANPHYQPPPAAGAPLALQQHPADAPLPSAGPSLPGQ